MSYLRLKRPRIQSISLWNEPGLLGAEDLGVSKDSVSSQPSPNAPSREMSKAEKTALGFAGSKVGAKFGGSLGYSLGRQALGMSPKAAVGLGLTGATALSQALSSLATKGTVDIDFGQMMAGILGYVYGGPVGFQAARKGYSFLDNLFGWSKPEMNDFSQDVYGYLDMLDTMNMTWDQKSAALNSFGFKDDPIDFNIDWGGPAADFSGFETGYDDVDHASDFSGAEGTASADSGVDDDGNDPW